MGIVLSAGITRYTPFLKKACYGVGAALTHVPLNECFMLETLRT